MITVSIEVRHPDGIWEVPDVVWPSMLPKIDREWVWIVAGASGTQAVLVTAPAHGMLLLLRLWKSPTAEALVLRSLIREAAKEAMERGMVGWLCQVSGITEKELKLAKLMLRFKGHHEPSVGLMGFGRLEDACQKH